MPYRQLPNTDAGRLSAFQNAKQKVENTPSNSLALGAESVNNLNSTLPQFEEAMESRGTALQAQADATVEAEKAGAILKMYISHFFQVFNLGVERGKFSPGARAFYTLDVSQASLPALNSDSDLLMWGNNIVTGDERRKDASGVEMTNPSPAEVETAYNEFIAKTNTQSQLKDNYDKAQETVAAMREQVDAIIKDIWDEVEYKFRKDEPSSLRRKAREYGVVYITRPEEEPEDGEQPPTPEPPPNP
ncbi:MAG: hypothetical protein HY960_07795 [Ignavibacteriae bacterium]|nr:hypothetical protein [Ignavibacteriota bacterium]